MKVLWLSHFVPYPPRGGNLQRSFHLIREAAKLHEVSLVALNVDQEKAERLSEYKRELQKYCAEVEIWEPPYPWGGRRWQAELLRSAVLPAPFSCRARYSPKLGRKWEAKLAEHQGSLVHIDAIDLALFVPAADNFRKVLNHHNCESLLALRRAASARDPLTKNYLRLEARKLARWESALLGRFEVNTVVSDEDRQRLTAINPSAHFHLVENGVDTDYFRPAGAEEKPCSVVYTASLNWAPNASAARFFVEDIWPLVKNRCPDARLVIAGRNPPPDVLQFPRADSSIAVFANPDDIRPLIERASVYVCPIREGAGTRLKILDAMATGKAVVSTSIGCEGLRVTPGKHILIADPPEDFANSVLRLFADRALREGLGRAAREFVQTEYAWRHIGRQLAEAYECASRTETCVARSGIGQQPTSTALQSSLLDRA